MKENIVKNLFLFTKKLIYESFDDIGVVTRYIISGIISILVNLLVIYLMTDIFKLWYIFSAIIASVFSFVVAFTLQKYWTFKDNDNNRIAHQVTWYLIVIIINLLLNIVILYLLVDLFGFWYLGSQMAALVVMAGVGFFLNKNITFKDTKQAFPKD